LAEVSGSETFLHIQISDQHWVVQQAGVHQYLAGDNIEVFFNPDNLLVFDAEGNRLPAASKANAVG